MRVNTTHSLVWVVHLVRIQPIVIGVELIELLHLCQEVDELVVEVLLLVHILLRYLLLILHLNWTTQILGLHHSGIVLDWHVLLELRG